MSMMTGFRTRFVKAPPVPRLTTAGRLSAVVLAALVSAGITSVAVRSAGPEVVRVSTAANSQGNGFGAFGPWVGTWAAAPQLTEPGNMPPPPFPPATPALPHTPIPH